MRGGWGAAPRPRLARKRPTCSTGSSFPYGGSPEPNGKPQEPGELGTLEAPSQSGTGETCRHPGPRCEKPHGRREEHGRRPEAPHLRCMRLQPVLAWYRANRRAASKTDATEFPLNWNADRGPGMAKDPPDRPAGRARTVQGVHGCVPDRQAPGFVSCAVGRDAWPAYRTAVVQETLAMALGKLPAHHSAP